jgi:hypothetical protein
VGFLSGRRERKREIERERERAELDEKDDSLRGRR